ncbi:MAG: SIS domain-containing protein [Planctomycetota bacterium]|jgi:fructoselysine-6-P-deglycase FrlB-like protein|nr:SIS domain-containing protein [Planctomycetota bacterium]MDP6764212.1 SIS domain-containing protein [Planctomycetota bacterium]MDP6988301.1 SIS domain-containing protein [Planctomycetota bacterium]
MASEDLIGEYIFGEIVEQPAIVARHGGAPLPPWPTAARRVLLAGAGDSLCAAELIAGLYPHIEALTPMAASAAASSLEEGDALIGISVSGRTPRILEACRRAAARGAHTVAVTDDPDGPLARGADETWWLGASPPEAVGSTDYECPQARQYVGYHHDVAQTKTFLAAVTLLARAREGGAGSTDWGRLAGTIADLVAPAFYERLRGPAEECAGAGAAFFLGGAGTLPLARFAAYKLMEFNRTAHFADIEEYCHTHYFVTRPGSAVVCVIDDADAGRRAGEIVGVLEELLEARVLVLCTADAAPPEVPAHRRIEVPAAGSLLERRLALVVALEWLTYLWGRVDAPDVNSFHGGYDTERLVAGTLRTIRGSRVVVEPTTMDGERAP